MKADRRFFYCLAYIIQIFSFQVVSDTCQGKYIEIYQINLYNIKRRQNNNYKKERSEK